MSINFKKLYNGWAVLFVVAIFIILYLSILHPWLSSWGATDGEINTILPGDGVDVGTVTASTRAITIDAPASEVWKWVVQLGQERAGFYSNDWLENLVLSDIHNADEIRPEWQHHRQGDKIYGAGGSIYGQSSFWITKVYEEGRLLYLWGSIVINPIDETNTRLVVRSYTTLSSEPANTINKLTYDWMHFVMERGMLLGIKARAEGSLESNKFFTITAQAGWVVATLGIATVLFGRRRGWWWGLIPLTYAISILVFTSDIWSAIAGFLWWGVIAAGFLFYGKSWWKGLALVIIAVILTFVLAPQPYFAFGIIFLIITLICIAQSKGRKVATQE